VKFYKVDGRNLQTVLNEILSGRLSLDYYVPLVKPIIDDVRSRGDKALLEYVRKFDYDGASLERLRLQRSELAEAYSRLDEKLRAALNTAAENIRRLCQHLLRRLRTSRSLAEGVRVLQRPAPIPSVGCYVPGGGASYPSTVLMTVVPAKVCGVPYVAVCTPPSKTGEVPDVVKAALYVAGADEAYSMGGPHAIAAMAYGTESVRRVAKIVGPGGPYVTAAKKLVSQDVAIDMLAGATELVVYGEDVDDSEDIAFELCAQSEHSPDTFVGLVTTSENLASEVMKYLDIMVPRLERGDVVRQALERNGFVAVCDKVSTAVELIQKLAPEHLYLASSPNKIAPKITSAGLISAGRHTSPVLCDYIVGVNHILPTSGQAALRGGLSVMDFVKIVTEVRVSKAAARRLGRHAGLLARAEGLMAHAYAAERWL
jgi:histidinol dehydrogenase